MIKHQGSIASSTYATKFSDLRTAAEDTHSLHHMMRYLGCNVSSNRSCPTRIFGDNLSIILNAKNPAADLTKKHVAIAFHILREAIVAGIIEPCWLKGTFTMSNIMTK